MALPCAAGPRAAAGAWLVVCLAAFLQPALRAGGARYDGWFHNPIDAKGPASTCHEASPCESVRPVAAQDAATTTLAAWQFERLYTSSAKLPDASLQDAWPPEAPTAAEGPDNWACVIPAVGIPGDGQSFDAREVQGRRLDPEVVNRHTDLDYDPDAWPAYLGMCLILGAGFVAAACCFHFAQGSGSRSSRGAQMEGHDATRQVLVANFSKPRPAHLFGQLAGPGKAPDRFRQIRVGVPIAGDRTTN